MISNNKQAAARRFVETWKGRGYEKGDTKDYFDKYRFPCHYAKLPEGLKRFPTGYYNLSAFKKWNRKSALGQDYDYQLFFLEVNYKSYDVRILEVEKLVDGIYRLWNYCTGYVSNHNSYASAMRVAYTDLSEWFSKELNTNDFFLTL